MKSTQFVQGGVLGGGYGKKPMEKKCRKWKTSRNKQEGKIFRVFSRGRLYLKGFPGEKGSSPSV